MAAHGVDLINEHDAGSALLGLLEEISDAAGAHTHEHLHKVRARDGEELHLGLARDGAGQQGLAGPRGAHQQHALGDLAAQLQELGGILQELDDLLQFIFGFVAAGDICEGRPLGGGGKALGAGFAEAEGLVATHLGLAHEDEPEHHEDQQRRPEHQHIGEVVLAGLGGLELLDLALGFPAEDDLAQVLHGRGHGAEPLDDLSGLGVLFGLFVGAFDIETGQCHGLVFARHALGVEGREGDLDLAAVLGDLAEGQHQKGDDAQPDQNALHHGIQRVTPWGLSPGRPPVY